MSINYIKSKPKFENKLAKNIKYKSHISSPLGGSSTNADKMSDKAPDC